MVSTSDSHTANIKTSIKSQFFYLLILVPCLVLYGYGQYSCKDFTAGPAWGLFPLSFHCLWNSLSFKAMLFVVNIFELNLNWKLFVLIISFLFWIKIVIHLAGSKFVKKKKLSVCRGRRYYFGTIQNLLPKQGGLLITGIIICYFAFFFFFLFCKGTLSLRMCLCEYCGINPARVQPRMDSVKCL